MVMIFILIDSEGDEEEDIRANIADVSNEQQDIVGKEEVGCQYGRRVITEESGGHGLSFRFRRRKKVFL